VNPGGKQSAHEQMHAMHIPDEVEETRAADWQDPLLVEQDHDQLLEEGMILINRKCRWSGIPEIAEHAHNILRLLSTI
jgi:hypothetical protein